MQTNMLIIIKASKTNSDLRKHWLGATSACMIEGNLMYYTKQ